MPKKTGRPPIPERDLHKQQRVALVVTGDVFNKLLGEAEKRSTSIGAESARLVRRAMDLEDTFGSRENLDAVQHMNRVLGGAIDLAKQTDRPEPYDAAIGNIASHLWRLYPAKKDKAAKLRVIWELIRALDIDLPELAEIAKRGVAA